MDTGDVVVIDRAGIDDLVRSLQARGLRTIGPVVHGDAIVHAEITGSADMPIGWHDRQDPGSYRLHHDDDPRIFAWAVGPHSLKAEVFPPRSVVWRADEPEATGAEGEAGPSTIRAGASGGTPTAVVGARPCEAAALAVLDAVLGRGPAPDPIFRTRRDLMFLVTADCGSPASTCFCASMDTGPEATSGFDLALTELVDGGEHRFVVRVGSPAGAEVVDEIPWRPATDADLTGRAAVIDRARAAMGRDLETDDLPGILSRTLNHPRWDEVADRCLACGNCTMVCPTCFCSTFEDTTDLHGSVERGRRWASCFEEHHSYLHGEAVRSSTRSRYRQWVTHKLGTWHDQFGMSGCVGCGRCITWCPVGIDITEEVGVIRSTRSEEADRDR
ncbi:MAG TPA: 4Fe-4S dicluster domain-containing protein [Acidimicrobiales bacterium]|nr:4Fe-4S dicluster domain-containing protein [Acidimicrobiales bacterium]